MAFLLLLLAAAPLSGCLTWGALRSMGHPACVDSAAWAAPIPRVDDVEFRMALGQKADAPVLVRTTEPNESPVGLLALDASSGKRLWNVTLPGFSWAYLAGTDESGGVLNLELQREPDRRFMIVALDARTGDLLWQDPEADYALAVGGGFLLDDNGTVVLREARTGETAWSWTPPGGARVDSVHLAGGLAIVETRGREMGLWGVDPADGSVVWNVTPPATVQEVRKDGIRVQSWESLGLLDPATGATRWLLPWAYNVSDSFLVTRDALLQAHPNGTTVGIDPSSGKVLWERTFGPTRSKDGNETRDDPPKLSETPFGILVESDDETRKAPFGEDAGTGTRFVMIVPSTGKTRWTMDVVDGGVLATSPDVVIFYHRGLSGLSRDGGVRWHCALPKDASVGFAGDARYLVTPDRIARVRT